MTIDFALIVIFTAFLIVVYIGYRIDKKETKEQIEIKRLEIEILKRKHYKQ